MPFTVNGKYTEAKIFTDNIEPTAMAQIIELCNQPMFKDASVRIMPDTHAGKGCVIGFTAELSEKKIVPNLVGVDIGCGVGAHIIECRQEIDYKALDEFIRKNIPSGFSVREKPYTHRPNEIMRDIDTVTANINDRDKRDYHLRSLGTLGGGNHYIELGQIDETTFLLTVHTGSRNLGKKICEFYQNKALKTHDFLKAEITSKHKTATSSEEHKAIQSELSALPKTPKDLAWLENTDFDAYISDMLLAKRFALCNRAIIKTEIALYLIDKYDAVITESFDTVHNYVDWNADKTKIIIRKGAISAQTNEKVVIPLNMRDGVIIATGRGNRDWNCSAPHGAGRLLSRSEAKKTITLDSFQASMKNINTWSVGQSTLDEAPDAYKPAREIIDAIKDTVIINAGAKPVYNFKAGE